MKLLILPLLAALTLQTSIKAESYWLVIGARIKEGKLSRIALTKIEMKNQNQCLAQGEKFRNKHKTQGIWYECIVGK